MKCEGLSLKSGANIKHSWCISDPTTGRVNVISSFQGRLTNKYIVSRLDSIDFDSKEILKNIGLDDRFPKTNVINNKSSDMEIEEYFSQLDKDTLDKLYKVYEMDFVLFNYTIDAFYPLVKNKTENIMSNWANADIVLTNINLLMITQTRMKFINVYC